MDKDWGGELGEGKQHRREAEHCSESTEWINGLRKMQVEHAGQGTPDRPLLSTIFRKPPERECKQTFTAHCAVALLKLHPSYMKPSQHTHDRAKASQTQHCNMTGGGKKSLGFLWKSKHSYTATFQLFVKFASVRSNSLA